MSNEVPVDAPWKARRAPPSGTARRSRPGSRPTRVDPALPPSSCRSRRGRSSAPSRASCRCCSCSSTSPRRATRRNPGTFERNFNTRDGAQMWRFVGGSQLIALRDRRRSSAGGSCCDSPVRRIVQTRRRRHGRLRPARRSTRKRVIVAIPPTLAGRIDYEPAAAVRARPAHPALRPGHADEGRRRLRQAVLARRRASTAQAVSTDGLVSATFDDSPAGRQPGRHLRLRRRRQGARRTARCRRPSAAQRCSSEFAHFFGDEAREPDGLLRDALDDRAVDPRLPGRHPRRRARCSPTATSCARRSAASTGPGTETSTYWNGYMDGAVRSGERAAQRGARRAVRRAPRARRCCSPLALRCRRRGRRRARRWDTQVLALVPPPGLPGARLRRTRTGRIYEGTYDNPSGDTVPSRVLEYVGDGTLLRSWTITGPGPLAGRTASRSPRATRKGRLVLLDKSAAARADPARPAHRRADDVRDRSPTCRRCRDADRPWPDYARLGPGRQPLRHRLRAGRRSGASRRAAARRRSG